ncbi:hypothetical protein X975_21414, partial [Stegodyphus mimosarum]
CCTKPTSGPLSQNTTDLENFQAIIQINLFFSESSIG